MKNNYLIFIICALFVLQSCTENSDKKESFSAINKSKDFIEANNKFAFDVFKNVNIEETKENFMISPVSLSLALAMTYNGAANDTKTAFENTLNYNTFSSNEINNLNKEIIYNLSDNSLGSILEIGNSIWVEKRFTVKEDFIKKNEEFYDAEIQNLDFYDVNSVDVINSWVSDKTYQKIPKIIDQVSPNLRMILINALYFKSDWKYNFDEEKTSELPFYAENETTNVKMMQLSGTLNLYENEKFLAVKLPYKNEKFSMTIFLPKENQTTTDIISLLSIQNWQKWNENYIQKTIDLEMPKFKSSYEIELNDAIAALGLGIAFTNNADFSGINNNPLQVSFIKQKTFIEVDEKGTEAAAVTAVGIETTSTGSSNIKIRLNKPFLYSITEKETGSICFLGKVGMPEFEN
jgi:serpin B